MDIVKVALAWQKNSKCHFSKDVENSFHRVTHIDLEPHQPFSFWNISTNTVARGVQSFGWNGPWWAGCLEYSQNFFKKIAQACDEQMLKIQADIWFHIWFRSLMKSNGNFGNQHTIMHLKYSNIGNVMSVGYIWKN